MDTREKFNIKLMVDCENQEPFYPATHAEAVKIIDEGLIKSLLDIIGTILEFIRNFKNVDLTDLLKLGHTSTTAFPGDEGLDLLNKMDSLYPVSNTVVLGDSKPVSGDAVYNYVSNLLPDGEIIDNDLRAVSGDTVYDYISNLIAEGAIQEDNNGLVTGGNIFNYISNLLPDGNIQENESRAVTGHKIWEALQGLEDNFWETDSNYLGSIKQKPAEDLDLGLEVSSDNEIAIGKYNISNNNTILSIGAGTLEDPINSLEVTKDLANSLKVPYNGTVVSILEHMRNGQSNIKHLTDDLLNKLDRLIADKWKASLTFTVSNIGDRNYYNNNTGISFKWNIKDSNDTNNNVLINYAKIFLKQGSNNYVDLGINVSTPNNINNPYTINDYTQSPLLINFDSDGSSTFTFKMDVRTNEIDNGSSGDKSIGIYAPCYVFCSSNGNILNLNNLPSNIKVVGCTSKGSFKVEGVTIDQNTDLYIYIATPQFIGITAPTQNNQPFMDSDSGFEFSLSNSYFVNTTKDFTVCNRETTTNYTIVRSDQLLTQGSTWSIKTK